MSLKFSMLSGYSFWRSLLQVSSICSFKSSMYLFVSLSTDVFPSDFCAVADHDAGEIWQFVGISYLCPMIVILQNSGDRLSFVRPFRSQNRTLKVFFLSILDFFVNPTLNPKNQDKKGILSPRMSPKCCPYFSDDLWRGYKKAPKMSVLGAF